MPGSTSAECLDIVAEAAFTPLTSDVLRGAFSSFPSGVAAVCAVVDGAPVGLSASSFTSVSLDPPLVSICVARTSTTWPRLRTAPRFGLSVLAEQHTDVCRALAAKTGDRFANVDWEATSLGAVHIGGSCLWLDCSLEAELPAGDHEIALLRVHSVRAFDEVGPLIFHWHTLRGLGS